MREIITRTENFLKSLPGILGGSVTAALSGGADSVAMLIVLRELSGVLGFTISAAHLNHGLRGHESDRDEEFCRDLCLRLGVPVYIEKADVGFAAKEKKIGIEEAGREIRYEFLDRVSGGFIATAHNKNDNTETLLMNIARGCGIGGLRGIPSIRGRIIRPLLSVSRHEIEEYLRDINQPFADDSTNTDTKYSRNRVRHNIIPELCKINPALLDSMERLSCVAKGYEEYITGQAKKIITKKPCKNGTSGLILGNAHKTLKSKAVLLLLEEAGVFDISMRLSDEITAALENGSGRINLPGGCFADVKGEAVTIIENRKKNEESYCFVLQKGVNDTPFGRIVYDEISYECYRNENIFSEVNSLSKHFFINGDNIVGSLTLRSRIPGDFIHDERRRVGKSLKKLFCEMKIPAEERALVPVVVDDTGPLAVLTRPTFCRTQILSGTEKIIKISIQ